MTDTITLHGFAVSPHVRAARLAFAEKGVSVEFQVIGLEHLQSDAYGLINPFRKMPSLTHADLILYETPALMAYSERIGSGASLEPQAPASYARMWQFVGIAQNYLFPVGVMQLYFHSVLAGVFGMQPDTGAATGAVSPTGAHLDVLEAALTDGYLAGGMLSLADLYCGAMVDYIARTRDGHALVQARPKVAAWLEALRERESFVATFPSMLSGTDQS